MRILVRWLAHLTRVIVGCSAVAALVARSEEASKANPPEEMGPVNVRDTRYQPFAIEIPRAALDGLGFVDDWPGMRLPALLDKMVVTATRTPEPPERVAASPRLFEAAELQSLPVATLDSAFRTLPSFSLFRRADSLTANPTTQGVSLRGIGPSGASRTLVLLDGLPLNDPFGGWINWSQIPRDSVVHAEIVPGGGATAWGNAALGGAMQLFTRPPRLTFAVIDQPPAPIRFGWRGSAQTTASLGDFGTHTLGLSVTRPAGHSVLQLMAEDFGTDGFPVVASEDRGPVDVAAWSRHRSALARWGVPLGKTATLTTTVRGYEEQRGNGTPYQHNGTRGKLASVDVAAQPADAFAWTATAYAQSQSFASTFGSIDPTRTSETPASNQYAVPATAIGANWIGTWQHVSAGKTSGSVDYRRVRGETRENYSYVSGAFTRERIAGGAQQFLGAHLLHEQSLGKGLRFTTGGRIDAWTDRDGHRRERDRSSGAILRDDHYADQHGVEFSPSAGLVWQPAKAWRFRGNAQQAFRRPTLNELYRPFRQGANVTEANAQLGTERISSAEVGADYTLTRSSRSVQGKNKAAAIVTVTQETWLQLGATVFWNELRDAVGNVTLAHGPGIFPLFGPLPAGGIGRQRLNLDRIRVQGAELSATWSPMRVVSLYATYLYDDAIITRVAVAPLLVGKRLAEVPKQAATAGMTWHGPFGLELTARVRWIARQFDDDENTLRLGETIVADAGLARPLGRHCTVFLNAENIGDARIETARSATGVVNVGTPRFVFGGLRARW